MSHRRKKVIEEERAKESVELPPIEAERRIGASRLRIRGGQLYNAWEGPCIRCSKLVEAEDLARNGLRCPYCRGILYRRGSKEEIQNEIENMRESTEIDEESMLAWEIETGTCSRCGTKMEMMGKEAPLLFCPNCTGWVKS